MADASLDTAVGFTLVIAASNDHISFARVTTTSAAAKLAFDYDAVEDIRIAVSELCGTLIANAIPGSELTIICRGDAQGLTVSGRAPLAEGATSTEPDELSEQVLDAVADSHSFTSDGTEVQFTMFRGRRSEES
jgi:serine/threonine-protein kinase RsbW